MILCILDKWSVPRSVSFAISTHFNCYSTWSKKNLSTSFPFIYLVASLMSFPLKSFWLAGLVTAICQSKTKSALFIPYCKWHNPSSLAYMLNFPINSLWSLTCPILRTYVTSIYAEFPHKFTLVTRLYNITYICH
jgi:hypothetical protein